MIVYVATLFANESCFFSARAVRVLELFELTRILRRFSFRHDVRSGNKAIS